MLVPNLHLVMPVCKTFEEVDKFNDLVDKTLAIRDRTSIQKFFLSCSERCDYDHLHYWLCSVVECKVEILVLKLPERNHMYPSIQKVTFCWDLFKTCDSLVEFTLKGEYEMNVPEADVLFPCLKKSV
ncbi:hypothetical protein Tco_1376565 [Tanacetum coccineum]